MKMFTTFQPETNSLDLRYDQEAQAVLNRVATKIASLCASDVASSASSYANPSLEVDLLRGIKILSLMGKESSRNVLTSPDDLCSALNLTCWATLYLLNSRQRRAVVPFRAVLMLLVGVTPVPIPLVALPPAAEVLDRKTAFAPAWDCYEMLRAWKGAEIPHLFVIQAYNLRAELLRVYHPGRHLENLLVFLDAGTCLFRQTMGALAASEVAGNGRKKGKN